MRRRFSRREMLRGGLATGLASLAGCLGSTGTPTRTQTSTDAGGTWPSFARNARNTGRTGSAGPTTGVSRRWKADTGGTWTGPVVDEHYVAAGNADGFIDLWRTEDGEQHWRVETTGRIRSVPAIAGETVIVGDDARMLYGLRIESGEEQWRFEAGGSIVTAPTLQGDTVYFGAGDGLVYAIDVQDGNERWSYDSEVIGFPARMGTPAVGDDVIVAGAGESLHAIDDTGERSWTTNLDGTVGAPTLLNENVFVGTGGQTVRSIAVGSGEITWSFQAQDAVRSSPAIGDEGVFVGTDAGTVIALERDSGDHRWSYTTNGPIPASPAVARKTVYAGGLGQSVHALSTESGELRWSEGTVGNVTAPAVAGGTLYVAGDSVTGARLYAWEAP